MDNLFKEVMCNLQEIAVPSTTMSITDTIDAVRSYMATCQDMILATTSAQRGNWLMYSNEQPCQGLPLINHTHTVTFRRKAEQWISTWFGKSILFTSLMADTLNTDN